MEVLSDSNNIVFCCFSYPLDVWPLAICFPVLLGCLPGAVLMRHRYPLSPQKRKMLSGMLLCLCLLYPYRILVPVLQNSGRV